MASQAYCTVQATIFRDIFNFKHGTCHIEFEQLVFSPLWQIWPHLDWCINSAQTKRSLLNGIALKHR